MDGLGASPMDNVGLRGEQEAGSRGRAGLGSDDIGQETSVEDRIPLGAGAEGRTTPDARQVAEE